MKCKTKDTMLWVKTVQEWAGHGRACPTTTTEREQDCITTGSNSVVKEEGKIEGNEKTAMEREEEEEEEIIESIVVELNKVVKRRNYGRRKDDKGELINKRKVESNEALERKREYNRNRMRRLREGGYKAKELTKEQRERKNKVAREYMRRIRK